MAVPCPAVPERCCTAHFFCSASLSCLPTGGEASRHFSAAACVAAFLGCPPACLKLHALTGLHVGIAFMWVL